MSNKQYPELCPREKCCGCSACAVKCPFNAIVMEPDNEGFFAPHINKSQCTACKLCETVCPVLSPTVFPEGKHPDIFAAWHKDMKIRRQSSSGGAFSALAGTILNRGGVVFGAAYDDQMLVHHTYAQTETELISLRQSKYLQSDSGKSFSQVKEFLKQNREVLFVGTPCQIAGLIHFLGPVKNERLITCDFVCHGVPSPLFFKAYLQWLSSKKGLTADGFCFRDKKSGWYDALRVCKSQGRDHYLKASADCYFHAFNRNFILRNSCYLCPSNGENRVADLTIGDFWGIGRLAEFPEATEIPNGISLICVHSKSGKQLLHDSRNNLHVCVRSWEEALNGNHQLTTPVKYPKERAQIFEVLKQHGFDAVRRRFLKKNIKEKIVSLIREYFPRRIILLIRGRIP